MEADLSDRVHVFARRSIRRFIIPRSKSVVLSCVTHMKTISSQRVKWPFRMDADH